MQKEITAKLRYLRASPRKVRLVADAIRGKTVEEADTQLRFLYKGAAQPIRKMLASSVANAKHNFKIERKSLLIFSIRVDEGPTLKRWRARAFGRAAPIRKRTSHVTLVLKKIPARNDSVVAKSGVENKK